MRDAARRSSGPRDRSVADVHPKHVPSDAAEEKAADQRGGVPENRDQVGGGARRGALDHPGRRSGTQRAELTPAHVDARVGEGRLEGRADPCPLGGQMRGGLRVEPKPAQRRRERQLMGMHDMHPGVGGERHGATRSTSIAAGLVSTHAASGRACAPAGRATKRGARQTLDELRGRAEHGAREPPAPSTDEVRGELAAERHERGHRHPGDEVAARLGAFLDRGSDRGGEPTFGRDLDGDRVAQPRQRCPAPLANHMDDVEASSRGHREARGAADTASREGPERESVGGGRGF